MVSKELTNEIMKETASFMRLALTVSMKKAGGNALMEWLGLPYKEQFNKAYNAAIKIIEDGSDEDMAFLARATTNYSHLREDVMEMADKINIVEGENKESGEKCEDMN